MKNVGDGNTNRSMKHHSSTYVQREALCNKKLTLTLVGDPSPSPNLYRKPHYKPACCTCVHGESVAVCMGD